MKRISFKKDKISIQGIGKKRFWFGIIAGCFSALSISLIFNRTREFIRLLTSLSQDLLLFEKQEFNFFNFFFASLSTVLGLSITIWIWMGNITNKRKKNKLYKQQARTNSLFFFWLIIFLTAQIGFLFLSLRDISIYDFPVNLYKEHALLFILTPIVIFAQTWFSVRLVYRSGNWILISFVVSLTMAFILYKTTSVDQNILNRIYFEKHKEAYEYITSEKIKSEKKYGIKYEDKTIETLKKRYSSNSTEQVWEIKKAFSTEKKVSLDTIILQKIIIHNIKRRNRNRDLSDLPSLQNWQYALPKDILKQISYFESDSNETKELFETLKEEILLVNKSKITLDDYNTGFRFSKRINNNSQPEVNLMLVEQLMKVRDSLIHINKYSELNKTLPEIKNDSSHLLISKEE